MNEFETILSEGPPNGLGRVGEVIETILEDRAKIDELFAFIFSQNVYVRMRAGDALEKISYAVD